MNLQQTIDELEKTAAKYTQAANSLRELQGETVALPTEASVPVEVAKRGRKPGSVNAPKSDKAQDKTAKPRVVSDEARARLSANMKARHAQRRAEREAAQAAATNG